MEGKENLKKKMQKGLESCILLPPPEQIPLDIKNY